MKIIKIFITILILSYFSPLKADQDKLQNDITKNWLAKKEGYTMVRIKEKELVDNYNQVKENISSLINESRK